MSELYGMAIMMAVSAMTMLSVYVTVTRDLKEDDDEQYETLYEPQHAAQNAAQYSAQKPVQNPVQKPVQNPAPRKVDLDKYITTPSKYPVALPISATSKLDTEKYARFKGMTGGGASSADTEDSAGDTVSESSGELSEYQKVFNTLEHIAYLGYFIGKMSEENVTTADGVTEISGVNTYKTGFLDPDTERFLSHCDELRPYMERFLKPDIVMQRYKAVADRADVVDLIKGRGVVAELNEWNVPKGEVMPVVVITATSVKYVEPGLKKETIFVVNGTHPPQALPGNKSRTVVVQDGTKLLSTFMLFFAYRLSGREMSPNPSSGATVDDDGHNASSGDGHAAGDDGQAQGSPRQKVAVTANNQLALDAQLAPSGDNLQNLPSAHYTPGEHDAHVAPDALGAPNARVAPDTRGAAGAQGVPYQARTNEAARNSSRAQQSSGLAASTGPITVTVPPYQPSLKPPPLPPKLDVAVFKLSKEAAKLFKPWTDKYNQAIVNHAQNANNYQVFQTLYQEWKQLNGHGQQRKQSKQSKQQKPAYHELGSILKRESSKGGMLRPHMDFMYFQRCMLVKMPPEWDAGIKKAEQALREDDVVNMKQTLKLLNTLISQNSAYYPICKNEVDAILKDLTNRINLLESQPRGPMQTPVPGMPGIPGHAQPAPPQHAPGVPRPGPPMPPGPPLPRQSTRTGPLPRQGQSMLPGNHTPSSQTQPNPNTHRNLSSSLVSNQTQSSTPTYPPRSPTPSAAPAPPSAAAPVPASQAPIIYKRMECEVNGDVLFVSVYGSTFEFALNAPPDSCPSSVWTKGSNAYLLQNVSGAWQEVGGLVVGNTVTPTADIEVFVVTDCNDVPIVQHAFYDDEARSLFDRTFKYDHDQDTFVHKGSTFKLPTAFDLMRYVLDASNPVSARFADRTGTGITYLDVNRQLSYFVAYSDMFKSDTVVRPGVVKPLITPKSESARAIALIHAWTESMLQRMNPVTLLFAGGRTLTPLQRYIVELLRRPINVALTAKYAGIMQMLKSLNEAPLNESVVWHIHMAVDDRKRQGLNHVYESAFMLKRRLEMRETPGKMSEYLYLMTDKGVDIINNRASAWGLTDLEFDKLGQKADGFAGKRKVYFGRQNLANKKLIVQDGKSWLMGPARQAFEASISAHRGNLDIQTTITLLSVIPYNVSHAVLLLSVFPVRDVWAAIQGLPKTQRLYWDVLFECIVNNTVTESDAFNIIQSVPVVDREQNESLLLGFLHIGPRMTILPDAVLRQVVDKMQHIGQNLLHGVLCLLDPNIQDGALLNHLDRLQFSVYPTNPLGGKRLFRTQTVMVNIAEDKKDPPKLVPVTNIEYDGEKCQTPVITDYVVVDNL